MLYLVTSHSLQWVTARGLGWPVLRLCVYHHVMMDFIQEVAMGQDGRVHLHLKHNVPSLTSLIPFSCYRYYDRWWLCSFSIDCASCDQTTSKEVRFYCFTLWLHIRQGCYVHTISTSPEMLKEVQNHNHEREGHAELWPYRLWISYTLCTQKYEHAGCESVRHFAHRTIILLVENQQYTAHSLDYFLFVKPLRYHNSFNCTWLYTMTITSIFAWGESLGTRLDHWYMYVYTCSQEHQDGRTYGCFSM